MGLLIMLKELKKSIYIAYPVILSLILSNFLYELGIESLLMRLLIVIPIIVLVDSLLEKLKFKLW